MRKTVRFTILVALVAMLVGTSFPSIAAASGDQSGEIPNAPLKSLGSRADYTNITAEEAQLIIELHEDAIILDVGTRAEYEMAHLDGALPMPLGRLSYEPYAQDLLDRYHGRIIIVYSQSGVKSRETCQLLANYGFKNVYNIDGGIDAWIHTGLAVEGSEEYPRWANVPKREAEALTTSPASGDEEKEAEKLEGVRAAINQESASWVAGRTAVSGLSVDEYKSLCGVIFPKEKLPSEVAPVRVFTETPLPAALDWRDKDGGDWTTPIRDQLACGSCWAFGSIAALESQINIAANEPAIDVDLSEQFLLSYSGGGCDGWDQDSTMDFLRDAGTVDETSLPYQANDAIPGGTALPFVGGRKWNLESWGWVSLGTPTPDEIKAYLQERPLVTAFDVYEDFRYYTGGVYEHVEGEKVGGHMVSIVGWNDDDECWIVKNSWGTDWGENGFFRIKWGECEIDYWAAYSDFELAKRAMSVDSEGVEDMFSPGDDVYVAAIGLEPSTDYNIWIQPDPVTEG